MNEHDLDAAIDDVAREMTAGNLDGAFRGRVLGRIEAQCKVRGSWFSVLGSRFGVRGSRFAVLGCGFAAAAMIVAAVVMFRDPHERAITESPIAHAPAAPAAPAQAGTLPGVLFQPDLLRWRVVQSGSSRTPGTKHPRSTRLRRRRSMFRRSPLRSFRRPNQFSWISCRPFHRSRSRHSPPAIKENDDERPSFRIDDRHHCVRRCARAGATHNGAAPAPRVAAPAPKPAPEQPAPAVSTTVTPPRGFAGQPVNIKVEVTITDQRGAGAAPKKTVTVVTGDQLSGFIRTQTLFPGIGDVPLNVDAEPQILSDGKIRLRLNLQYDLPAPVGTTEGDRIR